MLRRQSSRLVISLPALLWQGGCGKDVTSLPLLFWVVHPYPNYLIVYDPRKKPLRIIRILHGARDLEAVLK
jgi:plasmid stabilization system protein ParE